MSYWYLASVYSKHPLGLDEAHAEACYATTLLMRAGIPVFSPIAHTHPIEKIGGLVGMSHDFWMAVDKPMVDAARGVIVLMQPGWSTSKGVCMEIAWAKKDHKPVIYMTPGQLPFIRR